MEQVAHFRIVGKMGAGGMGEVYRARDEQLHRNVAIKVVPASQFSDATARARLLREARAAGALNHPNICVVHEVGESSGQAYIAMECVEGETLAARISRAPLSVSEVIRFGLQLADALAHAHEHGVVHRDLKPANVIVTPEQRLKVLDFGLAKRVIDYGGDATDSTDILVTQPGVMYGTPAYMAPEQLRGVPADARSDLWSLGVMLHEMASGSRPFGGNTWPELSASILSTPPRPLPPSVPPELGAVIRRCLEKKPAERYQQAIEVRSALELIQSSIASSGVLPRSGASRRWNLIAATILLVAVVASIGLNFDRLKGWLTAAAPSTPARATRVLPGAVQSAALSIAVLPFENFSGAEEEYLVDGMHDAVIGELARIGQLRVISRTSMKQFKNSSKTAAEIASALNADDLVEGSVVHAGDRVRVQVKLIRAAPEERQVWSQVYERDMRDVLALYADIAGAIALQVDSRLAGAAKAARAETTRRIDPEVYRLYLKGLFQIKKETDEGFTKGLAYLREANERDPADPLPYAGLALAYAARAHNPTGTQDDLQLAKAAANKSLELDPAQAQAYAALAEINLYDDWDWSGSERNFRRALQLNPTLAEVRRHWAWYLLLLGRGDEAVAEIKRARDTDPLPGLYTADLAWILLNLGRYDEGLVEARRGYALAPGNPYVLYPLGALYARKGMFKEAIEVHGEMARIAPEWQWGLGHTLALAGKDSEARKVARDLERVGDGMAAFGLAEIHAALGEKDEAFRWLAVARAKRFVWIPWVKVDRSLEPLRNDPRFRELLKSMNVS